jgi:hypothetical protein
MSNTHVQGDTEVAIDVELSNKNFCLDDPEQRQHYTKYMSAKEKERFAKCYVRSLLETKEKILWFRRMTNPSIHKIYKDTYESGEKDSVLKQSKGSNHDDQ